MESPHGKFKITVDKNQITTELSGSFNAQGIENWIGEMKQTISSFTGKPFTILVNELAAKGATPDALEKANQYNDWLNSQNLVAKAVVYSELIYREIDKKSLPARAHQNIEFFSATNDAQQWIDDQWASAKAG